MQACTPDVDACRGGLAPPSGVCRRQVLEWLSQRACQSQVALAWAREALALDLLWIFFGSHGQADSKLTMSIPTARINDVVGKEEQVETAKTDALNLQGPSRATMRHTVRVARVSQESRNKSACGDCEPALRPHHQPISLSPSPPRTPLPPLSPNSQRACKRTHGEVRAEELRRSFCMCPQLLPTPTPARVLSRIASTRVQSTPSNSKTCPRAGTRRSHGARARRACQQKPEKTQSLF